jgi:hypothetical protein
MASRLDNDGCSVDWDCRKRAAEGVTRMRREMFGWWRREERGDEGKFNGGDGAGCRQEDVMLAISCMFSGREDRSGLGGGRCHDGGVVEFSCEDGGVLEIEAPSHHVLFEK